MIDQLTLWLIYGLCVVVLSGVALGVRTLFYQGSVQQRFDDLFTEE